MNKIKKEVYQSLSSKFKNERPIFVATVKQHLTKHGTKMHNIEVIHDPNDCSVSKEWINRKLVRVEEDGDGLNIRVAKKLKTNTKFYLDYAQAHDLLLALNLWHKENQSGMFKKVK